MGVLSLLATIAAAFAFFGPGLFAGTKLFFTNELVWSDFWHMNYAFRRFFAEGLAEGRLPLWCPDLGTGYPLLADGQVGALYPPNLLLYSVLPLSAALNWELLLHLALAGAFAGMLARQMGAGRIGSALAAIVYGLCGFFLVHLKHANMIVAGAWFPLILLLLARHSDRRRIGTLVLLALAVGFLCLGGHPQVVYNDLLLAGFWCAFLVARAARRPREEGGGARDAVRLGGGILLATALGVALAAPQLLPTWELKGLGPRNAGLSEEEATHWDFRPGHLVGFVLPHAFGDPGRLEEAPALDPESGKPLVDPRTGRPLSRLVGADPDVIFWEVTGYVGLLPLLFAFLAPFLARRRRPVLAISGLLVLALWLALGRQAGLFTLFRRVVPGFDLFRFSGRFLLYTDLALAVLAGIGLTAVLRRVPDGAARWARLAAPAVLVIAILDLFLALGRHNPQVDAEEWLRPPTIARRIREAERVGDGTPFRIATIDPDRWVFRSAYRVARGWKGDLTPYRAAFEVLDPNLSLLYGLDNACCYSPLAVRWMDDLTRMLFLPSARAGGLTRGVDPRIAALLNVRYLIDPFAVLQGLPEPLAEVTGGIFLPEVHRTGEGTPFTIRLHRNPNPLPRAFLVPGARQVPEDGSLPQAGSAMARALLAPGFDPRREILISGGEPPGGTAAAAPIDAAVELRESSPHRVRLRADAPRDAWLFLSDTFYPGWIAKVDGREETIRRADLAGRAIRFPAGAHEVVFEYRPAPFRRGLWVAGIALAALAGLLVLDRRRRRRAR